MMFKVVELNAKRRAPVSGDYWDVVIIDVINNSIKLYAKMYPSSC